MKKYPIGLQLYSVRSDLYKDFEGTLKAVSEMGYDGVEFAGLYGRSAKEVKDLCAKYGLAPVSAHVALAEMEEEPDKTFETYKEIGCRYIAVPYLGDAERPGHENYDRTVESIARLAEKSKEYGLQMMYHNHDFEFVRMANGLYGYDDLFARVPKDLLTCEIDVCWVKVAGEDPAGYLQKYKDRIPVVHFKDYYKKGDKNENLYSLIGMEEKEKADEADFSFKPLGCGMQNLPGLLSALDGTNCAWIVVEQDEPSDGKSRLECAKISIDNLKKLMK